MENSIALQKPNVEAEVYNNKKCDWIYTYIYIYIYAYTRIIKVKSPTKVKHNTLTWWTKEAKNYIYQLRAKWTKGQTGK